MSIAAGVCSFILFLLFQAQGISTGDSGDLVTAAYTFGVAHPPGYPLYTFLGWIVSHIPLFTVAWRVTLLSSAAHALTVSFVFDIVWKLTKNKASALFSALLLVGNYLFFLYSTTPEVFALLDLFVISLIWLAVNRRFLFLSFVFGLALSHHHMILFMLPAFGMYVWKKSSPLLFIFGLLPYLYIPIAAGGSSIINWDHATTLSNFIRLITRADYGTFQSGAVIGLNPIERFLQLRALGNYILVDFGVIGIFQAFFGFWYLWKQSRNLFVFFLTAIFCMGPLFFFYASYPIANRFTLATFERFMLPMYVMLCIVIGLGLTKILSYISRSSLRTGVLMVSFLYPLVLGGMTFWRFWGMPLDRTAENFARDVFAGVPEASLLALGRDTTLFTTQYERYAHNLRPDTILVHGSFINSQAYQQTMQKVFPELLFPAKKDETFLFEFLSANAAKRRVFSNIQYPLGEHWFWVPHGLLFELIPEDRLPAIAEMNEQNSSIWAKLHDPTTGILSRYNHLMLSDVRDVYAASRLDYGKVLLKAGEVNDAQEQFQEAIRMGGDTQLSDAYMYNGLSALFLDQCDEAIASFQSAKTASLYASGELALYEAITYRDCAGDSVRAQELFDVYEASKIKSQQPLEGL